MRSFFQPLASAPFVLALTVGALTSAPAFAAYRCELFDRAPDAPGGDIPVAVYFSDTDDVNVAKAACSSKIDRRTVIDYWLKWLPANKLPSNWKDFDLLAGAPQPLPVPTPAPQPNPQPIPQPGPEGKRGYACRIYDKPADAPQGDVPLKVLYTDVLKLPEAQKQCIAQMRAALPNAYRDYEVRYLDALPEDWESAPLFPAE